MITPSFGLTATERVLPKLALDFTTATLDPRVTFTRSGNTATYTNSSGVITAINADLPRFDYNPTTLICQGLLIEEARTNLLLNSLINGANLSTQSVTVTAVSYTLSFYGTGSIDLSGTHTATVTGTGAYPSRKTYTFTPTAGTLTLTVTGTVQYAQLEAGSFATSFIPTSVASVTRNADVATMTGTNFSSWYNASEGAFEATCSFNSLQSNFSMLYSANNGSNSYINTNKSGAGGATVYSEVADAGSVQATINNFTTATAGTTFTAGLAYKANSFAATANGGTVGTDSSGTIPSTINKLDLGFRNNNLWLNGYLIKLRYWPQRLTNAELQAFSK